MWIAAGLFVIAGLSGALNTVLVARDRGPQRLPFFRRVTTGWRWGQWLTYFCTVVCSIVAVVRASHHTGWLEAYLIEAVVVLGPPIAITAAHNRRLSQGGRES